MSTATVTARRPAIAARRPLARWLVRVVAVLAIATAWSVVVINTFRGWPQGYWPLLVMASNAVVATGYVAVGWILAERRPGNVIGPLLLLFGVLWAAAAPGDLYLSQLFEGVAQRDLPFARHAALYAMAINYPLVALTPLVLILFPNGRPLSRWWLLVALVGCALVLLGSVAYVFGAGTFWPTYTRLDSPFRVPGFPPRDTFVRLADGVAQAMNLFAVLALAVRWYRGSSIERAQVKWVALAAFVIFVVQLIGEQFDDGRRDWAQVIAGLVASTSVVLLPLAMGVAILRYRLYDIDRIVSRGVAYGAVSVILFAVYTVVNLVALAVVSSFIEDAGGTISVATATLTAAALFNPLRNRAQRVVDRRFHRSAYDAQRVVDAFGGRLRDQVDLALIDRELRHAAETTVEPASTALWLRADRASRRPAAVIAADRHPSAGGDFTATSQQPLRVGVAHSAHAPARPHPGRRRRARDHGPPVDRAALPRLPRDDGIDGPRRARVCRDGRA